MLLTITTTHRPATDLGYLLHKHPGRVQAFPQSVGTAHVFYPESTDERCTAALLLEVDPVALVRGRRGGGEGFALAQYVNDRPYAASSMLALAMNDVFRSAVAGRCTARPELVDTPLPLEIAIPAVPSRGGVEVLRRFFEPLGWQVEATPIQLDPAVPHWGDSRYLDVRLRGELRLCDALTHLYVLLPVLDDAKHYWVSTDEVDKLIRAGGSWLGTHPDKELITRRYLAHRRELTQSALTRLAEVDDTTEDLEAVELPTDGEETERPAPLAQVRRGAVLAAVRACGARRVGDLGCGEGLLVRDLLDDREITIVIASDVSARALQLTRRRVRWDRMTDLQRERLQIFQSSLTYRDDRLRGLDAAILMEVIEHVDPPRLPSLERVVFGHAAPATVIITTPNAEHNVRYDDLPAGSMRHRDHRFEWTRAEFASWTERVIDGFPYTVRFLPVGPDDPDVGPPTQLAIFSRVDHAADQVMAS